MRSFQSYICTIYFNLTVISQGIYRFRIISVKNIVLFLIAKTTHTPKKPKISLKICLTVLILTRHSSELMIQKLNIESTYDLIFIKIKSILIN